MDNGDSASLAWAAFFVSERCLLPEFIQGTGHSSYLLLYGRTCNCSATAVAHKHRLECIVSSLFLRGVCLKLLNFDEQMVLRYCIEPTVASILLTNTPL
uniref:Uncharacterized protein n=1 Tax=Aegilops tauschii subsp. strangulata TaxID=200361 RepID=A0A452YXY3_AEGTS